MFKNSLIFLLILFFIVFANPPTLSSLNSLKPISPNTDQITIPLMLNFQGKLTDINGQPVLDSIYSITFRLYTSPTGGTAFWEETKIIETRGGLFHTLLGSVVPITYLPLDGNCYLEMQVNPNPSMSPRIRIVSSAYSYIAKIADTANYAQNAPLQRPITPPISTDEISNNAITSIKIMDGAIMGVDLNQMGAATGEVLKWTGTTWEPENDEVGGDNAWVRGTPDSILYTVRQLGIARGGSDNMLWGNARHTHINLGIACTTGYSSVNYEFATIGGGYRNKAGTHFSTVGGGSQNIAWFDGSTVSGGVGNEAGIMGVYATVGGGRGNRAYDYFSTISGGDSNFAAAGATIGGGHHNMASNYATVAGGFYNSASGNRATVGGGKNNTASNWYAMVAGGDSNMASGYAATVAGGSHNTASDSFATVAGGAFNLAMGTYATVGGGKNNFAPSYIATVAGGDSNTAIASHATVGGGLCNKASSDGATVAGGSHNTASGASAIVAGGARNEASGNGATVSGGFYNSASSDAATVAGGYADTSAGYYGFTTNWHSVVPSYYSNSAAFNGQTATASSQLRCGTISKAGGTFTIDHPLDPYNKILNHYFIEGPEMRNLYDGEVILDASGRATVHLPDYFNILNRKPRIQLTGVGTSDVYVAEDIKGNTFVIGGKPGTKVYWQVTGERTDISAEVIRRMIPVEQPKTGELRERMLDDDFLVGCMEQLEREGKAAGINFRTIEGKKRYEKIKRTPKELEKEIKK